MNITIDHYLNIINEFELNITSNKVKLFDITINALDKIRSNYSLISLKETNVDLAQINNFYTRFALGLTYFCINNEKKINLEELRKINVYKNIIIYIFSASGFGNTKHLIKYSTFKNEDGTFSINSKKILLLLSFLGLDDVTDELMTFTLKQKPEIIFQLMMGWLSQKAILTAQGEKNRTRLLESSSLVESVSIELSDLRSISMVWMYCSYACTPNKHNIKKILNALMIRFVNNLNLKLNLNLNLYLNSKYVANKQRPRLLVIHERFNKSHAMYRCYASMIKNLKDNFELISLSQDTEIDEASETLFEKIYKIESSKISLPVILKVIQEINPDIIYYPSIGMKSWTILISNLRLAPIQVFTQGHPATTNSNEIDYVFVNDMEGDLEKIFSETILIGNQNYLPIEHYQTPYILPESKKQDDKFVYIGINSKVMKLNHRIIKICKRLNKESKFQLKFHFFPGERGSNYDGIESMIKAELPNAKIFPYLSYPTLLQEMKNCDILLSAFPFGNTNGTQDACMLGLPTVAHFGPECPSQTDLLVLKSNGYPEWLVSDSDEGYFDIALRLINDKNLRSKFLNYSNSNRIEKSNSHVENNKANQPISEIFKYIYENHLAIKSKNIRVIKYQDIKADL